MEKGVLVRLKGNKKDLEDLIRCIEKENLVVNPSGFRDNDTTDGVHIFFTVLPKKAVEQ